MEIIDLMVIRITYSNLIIIFNTFSTSCCHNLLFNSLNKKVVNIIFYNHIKNYSVLLKGGVVMGCYGGGDGEAAILFLILILLVIGTMGFGY